MGTSNKVVQHDRVIWSLAITVVIYVITITLVTIVISTITIMIPVSFLWLFLLLIALRSFKASPEWVVPKWVPLQKAYLDVIPPLPFLTV